VAHSEPCKLFSLLHLLAKLCPSGKQSKEGIGGILLPCKNEIKSTFLWHMALGLLNCLV
jgi:hypothetical protein